MICQKFAAAGTALVVALAVPSVAGAQPLPDTPAVTAAPSASTALFTQVQPISYALSSGLDQPAPAPLPEQTSESVEEASKKWRATQSAALQWEIAYLGLSAIDAIQTIECLNRDACTEGNPLFGKRPSAGRVILTKAGLGALHFLAFSHLNKRNPKAALRAAQFSAALQGTFVVLNARLTFK